MGHRESREEAPYNKNEKIDFAWHLEGQWKLSAYEPAGCAHIDDCNADFMFLQYFTEWPSHHFAGFDTYLRLIDES